MLNYNLLTKYATNLDQNNVLKEYPRPLFKRDSYLNLNGIWQYEINNTGEMVKDFTKDILVPFPIESVLSKVNYVLQKDDYLFYKKDFIVPKDFIKDITFINFLAVDQVCDVYLNGIYLGSHENGYLPFKFDISDILKEGKNTLILRVIDSIDLNYPTGKQTYKRKGMWYTPVSGIWQSVFLESVNKNYIKSIKLTPNIDKKCLNIKVDTTAPSYKVKILENNKIIYQSTKEEKDVDVYLKNMHLWSPEDPFLYDIEFETESDKVTSYFAMRKFSLGEKYFHLNNKPYFLNGLLDQGYYSDGIYTPASYKAYQDDILKMKELGFNTLRKHIKIESPMFYYYCDKLGMIVMQDFVNIGKYSFFKDTLLPTIGFKKNLYTTTTKKQQNNFIKYAKETLDYLYNVSSLAYYTIFNEGWGQFKSDTLYDIVKSIDSTRVIDTTSGWFYGKKSDVVSLHIYFRKIKINKQNKPIIISEFGGYSYKILEHSFNSEKTYGYKKFLDKKKFTQAFIDLYEKEIIPTDIAGCIYTQLSDVEDETNGILTYDRKICKLNKEDIYPIMEKLCRKERKNG